MLAALERVDLFVRLVGVGQVARVLALQQREAFVGKARMHRERHRVAQAAREHLVRRVRIARLQRRERCRPPAA